MTRSGLSMVKWKPLGTKYPASLEEWKEEFGNYQVSLILLLLLILMMVLIVVEIP